MLVSPLLAQCCGMLFACRAKTPQSVSSICLKQGGMFVLEARLLGVLGISPISMHSQGQFEIESVYELNKTQYRVLLNFLCQISFLAHSKRTKQR